MKSGLPKMPFENRFWPTLSPPTTPILIQHRPPIGSDRLSVRRIVWLGEVHLLRIILEAFDLIRRIEQKRFLIFISSEIDLLTQPVPENLQPEFRDGAHLIRSAFIRR